MKNRTLLVFVVFVGFMVARLPALVASDLVVVQTPEGKQQVICEILEETYKYVKIKSDNQEVKFFTAPKYATEEKQKKLIVARIEHGQKPPKYARAWNLWKNRRYAEAYTQFGKAGSEVKGEYKWLGPYIWYYAGQAAFNEAKFAQVSESGKNKWYGEAEDKYQRLIDKLSDHYFVPDAAVGLARAQIRLKKFDDARETIDDILASDYPDEVKNRAKVWQGRLLVEREYYDDAIDKLGKLYEEYKNDAPALAYLARISEAYAAQGKKEFRKAENLFRSVGLQSPDDAMRAEAFNSRGLSLMKRGQIREALFSFLRVAVLHQDIRQEYQKALYYAAITSKEYYSDAPQRAKELAQKLKNSYPDSYWTKKLQKEHADLLG